MMGTRCGDLDPGAVGYSIEEKGMTADAIELFIYLDVKANDAHQTQISTAQSAVSVWMTPTSEELVIAEAVARMLPIKP
jgi:acetate kinase